MNCELKEGGDSNMNFYNILFFSFFIPDYLGFRAGTSFVKFKSIYIFLALFFYGLYLLKNKELSLKHKKIEILLCVLFVMAVPKFSLISIPIFICAIISLLWNNSKQGTQNASKNSFAINITLINLFTLLNFALVLLQFKFNFKTLLLNSPLKIFVNKDLIHDVIYRGSIARSMGIFGHPLYLANFFVILLFYYIYNVKSFKGKKLYLLLMTFMIFMTFSRMAYILAFIIIIHAVFNKIRNSKIRRYLISLGIVGGIISIVPILSFVSRNERSDLYRMYGIRVMLSKTFSNIHSFMLGNRGENKPYIAKLYHNKIEIIIKSVDNFYVQYLYNYGFIIFVITVLFILKLYINSKHKHKTLLILLALMMNMATSTFEWDFNTTLLFLLVMTIDKLTLSEGKNKALIVFNGYLKKSGGVAEHAKIIHKFLNKKGYEAKLWSREELPKVLYYIMALIHKLDSIMPFKGFYTYSYLTSLYIKSKFGDYDYYIFEDIFTPMAFYKDNNRAMVFIHASKAEEIMLLSGKAENYKKLYYERCKRLEIKLLSSNNNIYTVSEEYAVFLKDYFNMEKQLPVIYNFLNIEDFEAYPLINRENICYFVGRLNNRKNPGFLVELAQKLKENNIQCKIRIIGDGELRESIQKDILRLELEDYLEYIGLINDKKVLFEKISSGKMLLLPSLKESFSYVLAEAKMLGLNTLLTKDLEVPPYLIDYELELELDKWYQCILDIINKDEVVFNNDVIRSKEVVLQKFQYDQKVFMEKLKLMNNAQYTIHN